MQQNFTKLDFVQICPNLAEKQDSLHFVMW